MSLKQKVLYALFIFAFLVCKLNSDIVLYSNSTIFYVDTPECNYTTNRTGCELSCVGRFKCANFRCINLELVCNGEDNCGDNSDESCETLASAHAPNETEVKEEKPFQLFCHNDEFHCNSGECINQNFRCDSKNDCIDNSDEHNCTTFKNSTEKPIEIDLDCQIPTKQCLDINTKQPICLPIEKFCDNHSECLNSFDEGGKCAEDLCFNTNCTGTCHNTPQGPFCYCPSGSKLGLDGHSCLKTEGLCEFGTCSQLCVPLKNRHKCKCVEGFTLESDGFTCKSQDPTPAYIIYSNRHEIRSLDLQTSIMSRPLVSGLKNTIALDFFHSEDGDLIFFTDIVDDKIYKGSMIQGSLINIQVIVETGLSTAESLAVDWIGHNLYWVESMLDEIEVAKFDGSSRKTLIAGKMESPRSIVVDPRESERVIFWSDWDLQQPRIESASMSGEDRVIIYNLTNKDGAWPNGLTLDLDNRRIYYVDARQDSVQTITYDGKDHREILSHNDLITHPFAISLFGSNLYITDWKTNSVVRTNKFNGSDTIPLHKAMSQPFDIKAYHPSRQPKLNTTHPCTINNGNCSHLCLLSKRFIYKCECPHIMKLSSDNRTCIPNEQVLLFARPNEIRGVDLDNLQYHIISPISLPAVINTHQLDFDAKSKVIYFADTESNELKRSNLNNSVVEVIIDTLIENPYGLAYDWISNNLFVTSQETLKPKIYVCNSKGEYIHTVINRNLSKPYSIGVDPFNGNLFWSDHGSENPLGVEAVIHPYIGMSKMDGSDFRILVSSKSEPLISKPSSLVLQYDKTVLRKLFWINVGSGTIQSFDLQTNKIETVWNDQNNTDKQVISPFALCLKGEKLIFSSQKYPSLYELDLSKKEKLNELHLLRNQSEFITALKIYDKSLQYGTNLCEIKNGNCSHLCLPVSPTKRQCKCAIGFEADPTDDTKCIGEKEFLLYSWNLGIKGVSLKQTTSNGTILNSKPVLPPISKVVMATNIDYIFNESYVYLIDNDDGSITRIKHDTTGYQTIVKNVDNLVDLCIDFISKNLYWIESTYDVIEIARLNGTHRYVIVSTNISKPTSLTCDSLNGYLFWSNVNESDAQIFRSKLDGSEQKLILNETSAKSYINKLAIDLDEQQLYWCDSKSLTIERMNYDGLNRTIVFRNSNYLKNPISIAVHKNFVYYADSHFENGAILKIDKLNVTDQLRNATVVAEKMGDHIKDLTVYHEQPTTKLNPCTIDNGGCAELCLFMGNNKHRCICSHGRLSSTNNLTCEPYDAFIMYSKIVDIDSIHISDDNTQNSPYPLISNKTYMQNVIALTFSYKYKKIFYSDIQKGSINSMNFNGTDHQILVDKQGAVEGIAFDSLNDEIYFTSNSDASINRFKIFKTKQNKTSVEKIIKLSSNVDRVRGIALDSCRSMIYWTNWNLNKPSIQRSYLSGNVIQSIITTDIRMPNAITLDHKLQKLYWSDARLDKIERSNFDGSNRVVVLHEIPQHPFSLAIYGDWLFWTDWICQFGDRYGKGCVIKVNKFTGGDLKIIKRKIPRPMGIVAVANDSEDCSLNPCLKMNGGCEERCGVEDNGTIVCSCFTGKQLTKDLKSCEIVKTVENVTCAADEFKCKAGTCISNKLVCDGDVDCIDKSDEDVEFCLKRKCEPGQFKCTKTGVCIDNKLVCDSEIDCLSDGSDEFPYQNCTNECKKHEFRCNNGECIPASYYCDYDEDCIDGSDEYKCGLTPHKCQNDQFKCKSSNKCIQKSLVCNNISECEDSSDEDPKMCNFNKTENCSKTEFECANKKCISINLLCSKKESCGDSSFDRFESKCGVNECSHKPNKCAHLCEDLPLGFRCSCHKGFVPIDDGKLCKDIDECNQTARVCSQYCQNKYGSYKCSCNEDYISSDNGTTCIVNSTIKPVILFSNRFVIRQIDLDGSNLTPKIGHLTNAVALDFDYNDSCIYWSNITPLGSSIKRLCHSSNDTNQAVETIHSNTVQSPDGLAVDWINKNLYFCDKSKDTIEVSKVNGLYRKILIKDGLTEPRAIVLDPYEGYLYYSDWGEKAYIGKAGMDGSNPRQIINASLGQAIGWPNALAIDYINRELFWGDAKLDFICVSDLEGGRRSVLISKHNSRTINHIFAISVFENYLYYSDWDSKSISKCEKYNCKNTTKLIDTFHRPMDLQVYHPFRQKPLNQTNPCDKLNCQTLCLLKPDLKTGKLSATCACPESFILNPDKRTCESNCTQFVCKTAFNCIPKIYKCDGQNDCGIGDNSDEPSDCPPFYCMPGQFQCKSGDCLAPNQICDNIAQCPGKDDEKNCDLYTCQSNQFKCAKHGNHSSYCIKKSKRCDCVADCLGGDDELDCPNSESCLKENSNVKCSENDQDHSYCKSGYCKGNKYVCQKPFTCLDKEYCYNEGKCSMEKVKEKSIHYTYNVPKCKCKDNRYKGKRCEQCDKLTCKNGGYCTYPMNYTTPECRCLPGYLGNQCQSSLCDNYCMNDGKCRLVSGIPECTCVNGFIGKSCSLSTCNGYCMIGVICLKDEGRQRCTCSNGFSGSRCEMNKCNCLNGGKCTTVNDTLTCNCIEGKFSGKHCQDEIVGSSKNESQSTGSNKRVYFWLAIGLFNIVALAVIFIFVFKVHERRRHFAHRRMNETHGNLEIRNPIFDGDLGDDNLICAGLNPAYSLDTEDEKGSSSFEHYNSYNSSPRTDESRNLLIDTESNLSRSSLEETKLNKFHPLA